MLLVLVLLRLYCKSFNVLVARARGPKAFAKLRRLFELTKCFGKFNISLTFRRELFHLPSGLCRFASAKVQPFSEPAKYFRKFFFRELRDLGDLGDLGGLRRREESEISEGSEPPRARLVIWKKVCIFVG